MKQVYKVNDFADLSNEDAMVTLYVNWVPVTYTIAFNGNGATSGSMPQETFTYDSQSALTMNSFGRNGYAFTGWNTVADGSGTAYSDGQSVKNLANTQGMMITLYAQWKKEEVPRLPFTDVPENSWYYSAVYADYFASPRLMNGMSATLFGPTVTLSRAQFATILYNRAEQPNVSYESVFPDVAQNAWYMKSAIWAAKNGVITGYANGTFGPADNITREQICVILFRYASQVDNRDTSARADLSTYGDSMQVSSWAAAAVHWAVAEGIMTGSQGRLNPQGNANRAEAASIIARYFKLL